VTWRFSLLGLISTKFPHWWVIYWICLKVDLTGLCEYHDFVFWLLVLFELVNRVLVKNLEYIWKTKINTLLLVVPNTGRNISKIFDEEQFFLIFSCELQKSRFKNCSQSIIRNTISAEPSHAISFRISDDRNHRICFDVCTLPGPFFFFKHIANIDFALCKKVLWIRNFDCWFLSFLEVETDLSSFATLLDANYVLMLFWPVWTAEFEVVLLVSFEIRQSLMSSGFLGQIGRWQIELDHSTHLSSIRKRELIRYVITITYFNAQLLFAFSSSWFDSLSLEKKNETR
jgi:hypothetical protein